MKKKGNTLVPRNPFALAARQRRAGAHDKTYKVKRRDDRQALRKLLNIEKEKDGDPSFFIAAPSVRSPVTECRRDWRETD